MNKTELIAAIAEQAEISKKDAEKALKAFVDVVTEQLKEGEKVQLVGFGTFEVSERAKKRRKKSSDRKDNEDRSLQSSEIQSWKSSERCCKRIIDEQIKMHKRIQSDKPVVFSFQLQEKEGEKIDEIGQIFKSFQADQTQNRSQRSM